MMPFQRGNPIRKRSVAIIGIAVLAGIAAVCAQESKPAGGKGDAGLPTAAAGDQVVIKRDAVHLLDPQRFRMPLYLMPLKSVALVAPHDGAVRGLVAKLGETLPVRSEVVRLDDTIQKFQLQRAQSLHKAAVLEQKLSADSAKGDQKELAQAKVDAAKADLDLAQYQMDQTTQRLPFAGEVIRYLVAEGQFVKAGEPVAIVGDTSMMQVEIPAERSQIERGKMHRIKVEGTEVDAKVEAVLPLDKRFDSLRELFDTLTSATLILDNPKRTLQPGQTVFVPLIPRHPVAEIPSSAIANRGDGGQKVQVLRDSVVRDIPVSLMGSVGLDRVFVNGPFTAGDEVIFETSHLLADGFPVKPGGGKTKKGDGDKPGAKAGQPKTEF